ncbi:MAG: L-serine ammonia-lyase, iron-sulfur-dependent subunit beta [Clostridia bacterium]|jgi:L-serine dehydratase|nr:L-serine ammonia-lyase, iron-sulfur-dependent subunit beta [Clostridia bacterium]
MENYSIFDIIGPVMIGPSSSHTAGAAKIGYLARKILDDKLKKVNIILHGSFAKTGDGHGTKVAILAGLLGINHYDERLKDAYKIAEEENIEFSYSNKKLGEVHPNTVKIEMESISGKVCSVIGSSIGAGKIKIINIDNIFVDFDSEYNTLILRYSENKEIIHNISRVFFEKNIEIDYMKMYKDDENENILIIETSSNVSENIIELISNNKLDSIRYIERLEA